MLQLLVDMFSWSDWLSSILQFRHQCVTIEILFPFRKKKNDWDSVSRGNRANEDESQHVARLWHEGDADWFDWWHSKHSMMVKSERCKEHVNTSGSYLALLRTISTLCRQVYLYVYEGRSSLDDLPAFQGIVQQIRAWHANRIQTMNATALFSTSPTILEPFEISKDACLTFSSAHLTTSERSSSLSWLSCRRRPGPSFLPILVNNTIPLPDPISF
jgi:hypothetical protein